jgi:hypothetical protein
MDNYLAFTSLPGISLLLVICGFLLLAIVWKSPNRNVGIRSLRRTHFLTYNGFLVRSCAASLLETRSHPPIRGRP